MVFFNPTSPRYQRSVILLQWGIMAVAGVGVMLTNWGTREHIFTDIQKHIIPRIDAAFGLTDDELEAARVKFERNMNRDEALMKTGQGLSLQTPGKDRKAGTGEEAGDKKGTR